MSHYGLGWAARDPSRDHYIVAIAPFCPGTFLAPFPLPQAFESLPDAHVTGGGASRYLPG